LDRSTDLWDRIAADERVNMWFAHAASNLEHAREYKSKLAHLICQSAGGPCKYAGADMATAYQGRGGTGLLAPMKTAIVEQKK